MDSEIDDLIKILDGFSKSEEGRMKILFSDSIEDGAIRKEHHHGRCDIGSPWARGCSFDVLEDENEV